MEYITIEECCDILDSRRIPITASERRSGPYPYYGANGIQDYVAEYIFDDELVLLAEDGGNFGSKTRPIAYRVSGKCWVNNHAHVLKPMANVDVDYLCYSLMFYDTEELVNGATRQKLTQAAMRKMLIPQRPITEQKKIVSELSKIQSIISARQQQIQKLDDLVKARFIELFGDPVYNSKRLPIQRLCKLGSLDRGRSQHRPRNDPKLLNGPYPLIQTGEVASAGLYITKYKNTYSELGLRQSKMWSAGTLCITIAANIAQTAILTFDACFPDSVVGFLPNDSINAIYMHYWFGFFQKNLEKQAPQVAQKNINLKILSELNVIVPTQEKQEQFAAFVEQTDKSKVAIQKALDEAQLLFGGLMQKYFG
jgi:type I restriction enzyme S subunit